MTKSFAEGIPDYPMDIWLRYQAQSLLTKNGRATSFPPREVADRVFSHHSIVSRRPLRGATRPPQRPESSWASRVGEEIKAVTRSILNLRKGCRDYLRS